VRASTAKRLVGGKKGGERRRTLLFDHVRKYSEDTVYIIPAFVSFLYFMLPYLTSFFNV